MSKNTGPTQQETSILQNKIARNNASIKSNKEKIQNLKEGLKDEKEKFNDPELPKTSQVALKKIQNRINELRNENDKLVKENAHLKQHAGIQFKLKPNDVLRARNEQLHLKNQKLKLRNLITAATIKLESKIHKIDTKEAKKYGRGTKDKLPTSYQEQILLNFLNQISKEIKKQSKEDTGTINMNHAISEAYKNYIQWDEGNTQISSIQISSLKTQMQTKEMKNLIKSLSKIDGRDININKIFDEVMKKPKEVKKQKTNETLGRPSVIGFREKVKKVSSNQQPVETPKTKLLRKK